MQVEWICCYELLNPFIGFIMTRKATSYRTAFYMAVLVAGTLRLIA